MLMIQIFIYMLKIKMRVQMNYFSRSPNKDPEPDVIEAGRRLLGVNEYKYLGIEIDSLLAFKTKLN